MIHNCANGITVASGSGGENEFTRNHLVERCYVYSNGVSGGYYGYNFQGEADGVTLQFNRFGRPNGAFELEQPMDAWRLGAFGTSAANPGIADDFATPTGDGLNNLWKYALGLPPLVAMNNSLLPLFEVENNYLTMMANRSATATDISWFVEVSPDLRNWFSGEPTPSICKTHLACSKRVTRCPSAPARSISCGCG